MAYTVDIQPPAAAAAGCSATCDVDGRDGYLPYFEYVYYKLTATLADGWTFGYFEWSVYRENATTGDTWDDGPFQDPYNPTTDHFKLYDGFVDLDALETGEGREVVTIKGLKAVFIRDPTRLLVNSANLGSPVQLVYDPTTNLLVADY